MLTRRDPTVVNRTHPLSPSFALARRPPPQSLLLPPLQKTRKIPGRSRTRSLSQKICIEPVLADEQSLSSPSPTMAMIQSLAPETISHILYIAYPVDQYLQRKARRGFYRLTSLVCRSWTTFAQAALWRFVYLDNYSIERFVAAGAGRYRIKKLFVSSEKSVAVGTLLRTVQGVQELEVLRSGSINSSCLSGTNLRGE